MFIDARVVKHSVGIVEQYLSGHHGKQEVDNYLLRRQEVRRNSID
jgi:hypothetical protein